MPLEIIIDGYNLIRGAESLPALDAHTLAHERLALITLLVAYHKERRHPITVVFDGWGGRGDKATVQRQQGVTVVYTAKGETADDWIKRKIVGLRYGAVVTSDKDISRFAERAGLAAIPVLAFEQRLQKALAGRHRRVYKEDERGMAARKKGPARRLSRAARRRAAILAKL